MLTSAIWIQARLKANIRAVIACDDRFGSVTKILCSRARTLLIGELDIDKIGIRKIDMEFFKSVGRAP